jgi:hypothetical protein
MTEIAEDASQKLKYNTGNNKKKNLKLPDAPKISLLYRGQNLKNKMQNFCRSDILIKKKIQSNLILNLKSLTICQKYNHSYF